MKHKVYTPYIGETWIWPLQSALDVFTDTIAPVLKIRKTNETIFPADSVVLRAFKEVPYDKVRVVILGQDPYHTRGYATGLAFDTPKGLMAPSLRNIIKEVKADVGSFEGDNNNLSHFEHLPPQGVLLLNSALTVPEGKPGEHSSIWKEFIEEVVKSLQKRNDIVWVLWGKHAQSFKPQITNDSHKVVEGAHPSPFSYHLFKGKKYFSQTNTLIKGDKINW